MTEENKVKKERVSGKMGAQIDVKAEPVTKAETMVYIGPDLTLVPQFSVFSNGVPSYLAREIEKRPVLEQLLVPVKSLSMAQEKLKVIGSKEYVLYQEAQKQVGSET